MEVAGTAPREDDRAKVAERECGRPGRVEPDLEFIRALSAQTGGTFKKCFQCGTCSGTCDLSPDRDPFPRKEMIWAIWGMKDRLLRDPDVWLCYQCNDCTVNCPRGGRPGDVMAAIRRQSVEYHSVPGFVARWVNQPQCIPLLLGFAALILTVALYLREPIEHLLGISRLSSSGIIFSYTSLLPQWLLNSTFILVTGVATWAMVLGVKRFWATLLCTVTDPAKLTGGKSLKESIKAALLNVFTHRDFDACGTAHLRLTSHLAVFYGFIALGVVSFWVVTARFNPLVSGEFIYPLEFLDPVKILANVAGLVVLAGCALMIKDRLLGERPGGRGTNFDWSRLAMIILVVLSGFITEILHYTRLEPHRQIAYFVHLSLVLALILYLPYSKLAHIVYRTTALVFAEYTGRMAEREEKNHG